MLALLSLLLLFLVLMSSSVIGGVLDRTAARRSATLAVSAGRSSRRTSLPVVRPFPSAAASTDTDPLLPAAVATMSNSPEHESPTSSTYSTLANFAPLTISNTQISPSQQTFALPKVEEDTYGLDEDGNDGMWRP
jgi:hypothetical protein